MIYDEVKSAIHRRYSKRFPFDFVNEYFPKSVIRMAGNSLNRNNPVDIDLYPGNTATLDLFKSFKADPTKGTEVIVKTRNSVTLKHNGVLIQLCKYFKLSLKDLVESFDFAHIKVGIEYDGKSNTEIYISPDWIVSKQIEQSYYTGSEYPLSSLMRLFKYKERGDFSGKQHLYELFKILSDLVERKFDNYEDFKDQLDAIDLGMIPENQSELDNEDLIKIFNNLNKNIYK